MQYVYTIIKGNLMIHSVLLFLKQILKQLIDKISIIKGKKAIFNKAFEPNLLNTQERWFPSRPLFQPQLETFMDNIEQNSAKDQECRFKRW